MARTTLLGLFLIAAAGCRSSHDASRRSQPDGGTAGSHFGGDGAPNDAADAAPTGGAAGASGRGPEIGGMPGSGGSVGLGGGAGGVAGSGSGRGGGSGGTSASGGSGGTSASGGGGGHDPGGAGGQALLLPSSCEARTQMATDDSCTLYAYCDSIPYITTCRRLDSGRWQCSSETRHPERTYEVEGPVGIQACAVVTGLSSQDPLKLGPDSCAPVSDSTGTGYCATSLVCGPAVTVDFAPNARVRLARYGSVACGAISSPEAIDCEFRFSESASRDDLGVFSDSLACRSLLEFCMSTMAPDFDGPRSCLMAQASSTSAGCQRSDLCSHPLPSTAVERFPTLESRYASCEPASGGGASCYCSAGASVFSFEVASVPDDAACAAAVTSCEPTANIEATGDVSCKPTSQTATGNACQADLSCTQPATVDGRQVVADGRLLVQCARAQPGRPWSCTCVSDQLTASFSLGTAGATPAQACAQAPQNCLEHIPVHLGPYGPFLPPPDPSSF